MKRFLTRCAGWGVLLGMVAFAATAASAANKGERIRAASEAVREALHCEIEGQDSQRSDLLQSALEQAPDYPPALWHTGHVRRQDKWLKFDELPELSADDPRLVEYRRRREETPNTVEGQLALAEWCAKHKLADQARAHLTAVLEIDPEHAAARQLLGYRRVEGAWLSEQEIQEAGARAQRLAAALAEWKPKIEEILQQLEHRSQKQREVATERLSAIDDPAAIPALELMLSTRSEEMALLMVDILDGISAPEAAIALARQAVFSGWVRVRQAAAEKLKSRDPVTYVPMLLSALVTPIQSRAELYQAPNGRLMYRHALYREDQERGELAVLETEYRRTVLWADDPETHHARRALLAAKRQYDAAKKARSIDKIVAEQNAFVERLNERICRVLSRATGENLPANPEDWWRWWNDYNGLFVAGAKPVEQAYHRESVKYTDPVDAMTGWAYAEPSGAGEVYVSGDVWVHRRTMSCLLAGTPVWTDCGLAPIEDIKLGDLVLSQNPETGELAYKPVLKTTLRPPVRLIKVVLGDKALQCSGGHLFWAPGRGWVRAWDLKEGMRLHTASGTAEVRSVHPTGIEELHNLVVADFHTYFVTEAKIFTHDNTIREPTAALVPGLVSR